MAREETLCQLFSMLTLQGITVAIYCEIADLGMGALHIANLSAVAFMQALLLGLLTLFLLKFRFDNHQASLLWLSGKLSIQLVGFVTLLSLSSFCLGYISSLMSYLATRSLEREEWLYSTTILLSFANVIYSMELVKIYKRQRSCVRYMSYLLFLLLSIAYVSQLGFFAKNMEFSAEIYFMAVLILLTLKIWWENTPLIPKLVLLAIEVLDIQSTIRFIISTNLTSPRLSLEILKCLALAAHAVYTMFKLGQCVYRCIKQHMDPKEERPMSLSAINSLEKVRVVEEANVSSQQLKGPGEERQEKQCSICTLEIPMHSEVYRIPCSHQYHCQCLREWLLLKNSCPTCRTRVE